LIAIGIKQPRDLDTGSGPGSTGYCNAIKFGVGGNLENVCIHSDNSSERVDVRCNWNYLP
jgi:hypothetical protein